MFLSAIAPSSDVKDVGYVIVRLLFYFVSIVFAKDNPCRIMISLITVKIISIVLVVQG
jgi:hypothetical protein